MAEGKKTTGTRRTAKAAAAPEAAVSAPAAKPAGKAATKTATPSARRRPGRRAEPPADVAPVADAAVVAAPVAAAPAPTNGHGAPTAVSPEEKAAMIAHAAYLRAERRQFAPGNDQEDWFEAEREIEALLSQRSNA